MLKKAISHHDDDGVCSVCLASAAASAINELAAFADTSPPAWLVHHPTIGGFMYVVQTLSRPVIHILPRKLHAAIVGPFWAEFANIGGLASLKVLIMAGQASNKEKDAARFEKHASEYLNETYSMLNNVAVVASLIINCTHLGTIGRPRPWETNPDVSAELGDLTAEVFVWVSFVCNVATETLAVILLSQCLSWRLAIGAHDTAIQKIVLLHEKKVVDNVNRLTVCVITLLLVVITFGGIAAHVHYGFVAPMALLALPCGFMTVGVSLFEMLLELHGQARRLKSRRNPNEVPATCTKNVGDPWDEHGC